MKSWVALILITACILCNRTELVAQTGHVLPFSELKTAQVKIDERYIDTTIKKLLHRRVQAPDSVINSLMNLYTASNVLRYTLGKINALMSAAAVMMLNKKEHARALVYLRKAYPYCLQLNKQKEREGYLVLWNSNMGAVFTHMGLTDSAMRYYYNGLNIALASDNNLPVPDIYYNMGILQANIKQYAKSIHYTRKAIALDAKKGKKERLAADYLSIASSHISLRELDTAKRYLQLLTALNLQKDQYNYSLMNELYASLYIKQGQPEKAVRYCEEILATTDKKSTVQAAALTQLGYIYSLSKQYGKSEACYKNALASYRQSNAEGRDASLLYNIYRSISIINEYQNDYKEAYSYEKIANSLQDSLNRVQNIASVTQMETRYRTAEKDKELTSKELQLVKVSNALNMRNILLGASLVIVILLTVQLLQRNKAKAQQQKVDRLKTLIEGEENERVRIGQQLHDDVMVEFSIVKMNMETLPTQFPEVGAIKEYRDIVQQLNNASIKLRHTAHNLMPDALLEEGLVSALIYFCRNVQQMTGITIDFQYHGDIPKLAIEREIAIYRVVQELIQNVIKHAAATEIMVQLNYWEKALNLTVEDNGVGIKDIAGNMKNGRGLNSIRTRLKAINGTMELSPSKPHGTFVDIDINL